MTAAPTPRVLVVYYSRTGTTRQVAELVAGALGADLEAIADRTPRAGILGFLRSGLEATLRRTPALGPATRDPADYDLVVVGTPTWSASVSSPVRSYLRRHRGAIRAAAFFCTCGGAGGPRPFEQMAGELGACAVATLTVRQAEVAGADEAIRGFARAIGRALATLHPAASPPPPAMTVN